ncbi:S-locus lectin protein kinase family protein [Perilla frutescens var. hirtella]|uniref:Receptor-like serine/threonine-protein kinase n=1 Tax=Perilla frutescens var. hirtella TaxID=608512 RepID=A0AAD4JLV1_PERFH|nr:S-locus lectin protein kinase family protein [Perilla frutescens var. hirtella]
MNTIWHKYYIPVLIITTSLLATDATDTINTSQILSDNDYDTVISSRGLYELGFFSPDNSKKRYVGIWFKRITPRTVVWVANRDNPLTDRSGMLRVTEPGHLVLLNATNATIWSTNASSSVQNPVVRLLDSGNLVVKEANEDNPEKILWQSFDNPTDTFLPGMKLGKNFVTGLQICITSWKSRGDPAPGDFTFAFDPIGYPQLVLRKDAYVTYRMGPWNGVGFSGLPNLQKNAIFTIGAIINKNEAYYHYEIHDDSIVTRFTLDENGVGRRWVWTDRTQAWIGALAVPIDDCDSYNACGPNGRCNIENSPLCDCLNKFKPNDPQAWGVGEWSSGCNRSTPLNCQNGDAFLKYSGIKLPDTQNSWFNETMTLKECKAICSKNCSCTAYGHLNISEGGTGCLLWFGDLMDIRGMSPGQDIYIRIASSERDSEGRKRKILIVTLSLVAGIFLLSLSLLLYSRKSKKLVRQLPERGRLRSNYVDCHPDQSHKDLGLPIFDLSTIIKATDNFSINNKLGEGGFGPVYKGLLEDGQIIAVKRLSRSSFQGKDEFKNEVICIAKLQHRNLVKLQGCCTQGEEMMLVYEYLTNKSLDLILFDTTKSKMLDWPTRFNIINGIARGLMYLHQDSRLRVIHRDLKASNILLDSDMIPKISDFGLARTFGGNETGANTNRVVGTYGYMSPEYAGHGVFSVKSDVFSFGVMVLEIVSGKENRRFSYRDHHLNFLGYAWMLYREDKSVELVDSCLRNSSNLSEVVRSIHVGLLCVQEHPDDRPSMSSVVVMLSNDGVLPEPKHPGFVTERDMLQTMTSSTGSCTNRITTSVLLEGR